MPITDITLRGMSRATSDINTPDGATAELINAVVENNEIRPMGLVTTDPIASEGTLLCIHSLGDGTKVYVFATLSVEDDGHHLYVRFIGADETELDKFEVRGADEGLQATTLGNVVVVSGASGMYYFLYRDGHYENLGQRPPFPKLVFGMSKLERSLIHPEAFYFDDGDFSGNVLSESGMRRVYTNAQALINTFLGNRRKNGRFVFPFFVRYALRLFDGSGHILHSAPILMNPSTDKIPFSVSMGLPTTEYKEWWAAGLRGVSSALQYQSLCSSGDLYTLKKWKNIVTHIDIFVSSPIYSYKELTPDYTPKYGDVSEMGCLRSPMMVDYGKFFGCTQQDTESDIFEVLYPETTITDRDLALPSYTKKEQYDKVKNTSLFYLVHSIPIDEIEASNESTTWADVPITGEVLNYLESRPVLKDDLNSLAYKRSNTMGAYNQRLTMGDMVFEPYEGYPLSTMRPIINVNNYSTSHRSAVTLRKGNRTITVNSEPEAFIYATRPRLSSLNYGFYYYPDIDAKSITIPVYTGEGSTSEGIIKYETFDLEPHASLNGAYLFLGYPGENGNFDVKENILPSPSKDKHYTEPNAIYQSQVGNPFSFPLDGITSIGNAPLIALAASSIEVSTGQMGDYPMYAFTEEGIWILSISKEGWISTPQLISHDVCLGKDAIVSLNRPVIFASKRGLMMLEGSKISCLSDSLLGPRQNIKYILSDINNLGDTNGNGRLDYGDKLYLHWTALTNSESQESFLDFLSGEFDGSGGRTAFFAYDYPNNRLLIMRPDRYYMYALSLSSLEFSKIYGGLVYIYRAINAYDGVYIQDESEVMKISKDVDTDGENPQNVIVITRPVKFGSPALKSIKRMLIRHNCDDPSWLGVIAYGSRDGENYHRITSLRGRSYKYFIFAIFGNMKPSERLSALSFDWEARFTNKLR